MNDAPQDRQSESLFTRVLLVEDDPSHRILIQRALAPLVGELELAKTVVEAKERLHARKFDLLVTDLSLPDSDGVSHVRELQNVQLGIPVVVLAVTTRIEHVVAAIRFGAKDFILKSFDSDFRELLRLSLSRVYSVLQVEEERRKLQVAIENSDDGLALINRIGLIRYANRAYHLFAQRCGGDTQSMTSLLTDRVANYEVLRGQLAQKLTELSSGGVWNFEMVLGGADLRAYGITISGLEKKQVGHLEEQDELAVWVRDISEMKRRERFQRELLSTTTHDLKGPMGAILTGTELVSNLITGQEKAAQILLRVQSAAHGVVNLIDEFLSARRIEDGSLILRPARHELRNLCEEIESSYKTIADSRKIELVVKVAEGQSLMIDRMGFLRVVGNLVSNALKFTPSGGQVAVSVDVDGGGNGVVTVADSGSGIEAAELSRIFDRYARLDRHQDIAGSGLGLFVVKSIVDAHGGSIQVESEVGKGTRFSIFFPGKPPVNERGELVSLMIGDSAPENTGVPTAPGLPN